MRRRVVLGAVMAAALFIVLAPPAMAHGDHDARPIARNLSAGPHTISLWQVYPDAGDAMTPHLIVLFDGVATAPEGVRVSVAANAGPMTLVRSTTTRNGWETTEGVDAYDVLMVTISDGAESWALLPIVVPPAPTSMLPMRELLWATIGLTTAAALWFMRRTARAWRRSSVPAVELRGWLRPRTVDMLRAEEGNE